MVGLGSPQRTWVNCSNGVTRIEHQHRVVGAGADLVDQGRHLGERSPIRRPVGVVVERQHGAVEVGGVEDGELGGSVAGCGRSRGHQHGQHQTAYTTGIVPKSAHLEAAIIPSSVDDYFDLDPGSPWIAPVVRVSSVA